MVTIYIVDGLRREFFVFEELLLIQEGLPIFRVLELVQEHLECQRTH